MDTHTYAPSGSMRPPGDPPAALNGGFLLRTGEIIETGEIAAIAPELLPPAHTTGVTPAGVTVRGVPPRDRFATVGAATPASKPVRNDI